MIIEFRDTNQLWALASPELGRYDLTPGQWRQVELARCSGVEVIFATPSTDQPSMQLEAPIGSESVERFTQPDFAHEDIVKPKTLSTEPAHVQRDLFGAVVTSDEWLRFNRRHNGSRRANRGLFNQYNKLKRKRWV